MIALVAFALAADPTVAEVWSACGLSATDQQPPRRESEYAVVGDLPAQVLRDPWRAVIASGGPPTGRVSFRTTHEPIAPIQPTDAERSRAAQLVCMAVWACPRVKPAGAGSSFRFIGPLTFTHHDPEGDVTLRCDVERKTRELRVTFVTAG